MGPPSCICPSLTETSLCCAYLYTEWPFIFLLCCYPRFLLDKINFGTLYLCNAVGLHAFFAVVGGRCDGRIWRSVILPVLCGSESWSRTWNIEHWLRVKIALFWNARPCDLVARCHRFGWPLYLHLQDGKVTVRSHYTVSPSRRPFSILTSVRIRGEYLN